MAASCVQLIIIVFKELGLACCKLFCAFRHLDSRDHRRDELHSRDRGRELGGRERQRETHRDEEWKERKPSGQQQKR